jgi:cholesterol transport system auxiliary component
MKRAIVVLAAALLAGCASSGSRQAERYYVLEAPAATAAHPVPAVRVGRTSAASFYDTQDIAYSRAPGTRAYYQFNRWTERPQQAIHAQLVSRLEGGGQKSHLVLNTRVEEIYHDAATPPGTARIAIAAQLADAASGAVLARRSFSRSAPAASYDAPGAVQGFRQALGALLDDVAAWIDTEQTRRR